MGLLEHTSVTAEIVTYSGLATSRDLGNSASLITLPVRSRQTDTIELLSIRDRFGGMRREEENPRNHMRIWEGRGTGACDLGESFSKIKERFERTL